MPTPKKKNPNSSALHYYDAATDTFPAASTVGPLPVKISDGTLSADVIDRGTYSGVGTYILDAAGDPIASFGGGTQYVDGAARGTATGTLGMVDDGANIQSMKGDSSGRPLVTIDTALPAGTALIGKVGIDQTTDGTTNFVRTRGKLTTLSDGLVSSIATGGTAVTAIAADANGYHYFLQNTSTGDLWYSTLATAVVASPSIRLSPGDSYETPVNLLATGALSVIGATTGQTFTARKW